MPRKALITPENDPLWYKDAIIYELHVRAFQDSNGDGIGDFPGLTQKLDYLQDLGVTALWLLPFYPSPLRDDGYDIADYFTINPIYGTLSDFKHFLREAHGRGLRVITELVINHTSDQHPWFQKSRRAKPGSAWRDYYVWSDSPDKYKEVRIIFRDFEPSNWTWDPVAHAYYWHRFFSHQPDLNFDNPQIHKEITRVLDFWLDLGVDGLRLDAIPYLYEREGTSCENLPETHAYLKTLRSHIDEKYGDRMLLAEANQWPEDAVTYLGGGRGDECHMAFHFPVMPRLFMAVRMEDRIPIVDILEQTPAIPETSQWALFLRNHDELTLEMVTDEERDYMYRVYAHDLKARINLGIRRRLAPLLGNDRKKIELLNLLLFSLPGTPVLYYGDEIGMGDNVFLGDRNGVRTPMQWSSDKNAGFSRASPHALFLPIILDPEYHYESFNVETQQQNPHSLLWWMKRVLTLRKRWKAFGQGTLEFLHPDNRKILAFIRRYGDETLLVVANLSRFPQPVELDLSAFRQMVPFELFGRTEFPIIADRPYFLTLSPHAAFWFALKPAATGPGVPGLPASCELLTVKEHWRELVTSDTRRKLENCLPAYLRNRRWFASKTREIKTVNIADALPVMGRDAAFLLILAVDYVQGDPEQYLLPVSFAEGDEAGRLENELPHLALARVRIGSGEREGILYDASGSATFNNALLDFISRQRTSRGTGGKLEGSTTAALRGLRGDPAQPLEPNVGRAEQSNSAVLFGDRLFLKYFRRLDPGVNPDIEIGRFLSERDFPNVPALAGGLEYERTNGEKLSLAILSAQVSGSTDAWAFTLDALGRYYERVRSLPPEASAESGNQPLLALAEQTAPDSVMGNLGTYFEAARLLGQRTGELHLLLGSETENKDFIPEPYTPFYQRSLYQSMRNLAVQNLQLLRRQMNSLADEDRMIAQWVAQRDSEILNRLKAVHETRLETMRIRCHGDYHLGQVLYTGKDFFIIDFEGEPARPLSERRIKRSPFRDIAGMLRSFHYATHAALLRQIEMGSLRRENLAEAQPWSRYWYRWVSATFLRAYLEVLAQSNLLPKSREHLQVLLDVHLIEKAVYEIGYELNNRPAWLKIPLEGVLQLLEQGSPR